MQKCFAKKWQLPDQVSNEYSTLTGGVGTSDFVPIRTGKVRKQLLRLKDDSATGPDRLPARILKYLADVLVRRITVLSRRILQQGRWPAMWCCHWICPLYKKKSVFDPNNYRGLQITPQLSKLMERIIGEIAFPGSSMSVCSVKTSLPTLPSGVPVMLSST